TARPRAWPGPPGASRETPAPRVPPSRSIALAGSWPSTCGHGTTPRRAEKPGRSWDPGIPGRGAARLAQTDHLSYTTTSMGRGVFRARAFDLWGAAATMAVQFAVLASGSSGNATLIRSGGAGLLVDLGIGPRTIAQRLESVGASWDHVGAAVLTHTHGDHV